MRAPSTRSIAIARPRYFQFDGGPLFVPRGRDGLFFEYDENFWPEVQTVTAGAASSVATYHYDVDGLVEDVLIGAQTYDLTPNATTGLLTATSLGSLTTSASYNAFAELDSTRARFGAASLYAAQYARDGLGRITRWTETVGGTVRDRGFYYDPLGRLTDVRDSVAHEVLEHYVYGVNSNRDSAFVFGAQRASHPDVQDRLLDEGSATYSYTGNGERLQRIDGAASQTTTYDALGNLRTVDLEGGTQITYVVDGRNRRVGRKVNGAWTHRWLYQNALSVVAELDGTGALKKRFVYASRGHVPDVMVVKNASGPDSTYRLITDHLGSVRLVVNVATGAVVQRLSYDAWGNVTEDTNEGFQPFGYAGGLYDPETGLVRFGARDYDAKVGRWLSKDPIGFGGGGSNLFGYVEAHPIGRTDPEGLATRPIGPDDGSDGGELTYPAPPLPVPLQDPGLLDPIPVLVSALTVGIPCFINSAANQASRLIAGRLAGFTAHGADQAITRGVTTRAILDAARNPLREIGQADGTTRIIGREATIVINSEGKVVTVWRTSSKLVRKLLGQGQ